MISIYTMTSTELFIILAVILSIAAYLKYYLKPKKNCQALARKFEEKGYRVYLSTVVPFLSSYYSQLKQDTKKGDAMKTVKQIYSHYDVQIGNMKDSIRITIMHPKLIKEFSMTQKDYVFNKAPLFSKLFDSFAEGLLFSEGEKWKNKRRIISNVFSHDFLVKMLPQIVEIYEETLEQTSQNSVALSSTVKDFDLYKYTSNGACYTILECFLGGQARKLTLIGQKLSTFIIHLLDDIIEEGLSPLVFLFGPSVINKGLKKSYRDLNNRKKVFNAWARSYFEEKFRILQKKLENEELKDKKPNDLVQAFLLHNREIGKGKDQETLEQVLDEFKLFLVAGTDTTANYLQFLIYYIGKDELIQAKVRQEINLYMQSDDFSFQNLKNLKYIEATMKQTTRMYGPANFILSRVVTRDCQLDGVPIRKGYSLSYNSLSLHYSDKYYKDPTVFRPQRWLNGECDNLDPYAFLGFSSGPRSCIGRQLALFETKIGLIKLMKRYSRIQSPTQTPKMFFKFGYVSDSFNIRAEKAANK